MDEWKKRHENLQKKVSKMDWMMTQVKKEKERAVESKTAAEKEVISLQQALDEILQALNAASSPSDVEKQEKEGQRRDIEKELILARGNIAKSDIIIDASAKRLESLKKDYDIAKKHASLSWTNYRAYADLYSCMMPPIEDKRTTEVSRCSDRKHAHFLCLRSVYRIPISTVIPVFHIIFPLIQSS